MSQKPTNGKYNTKISFIKDSPQYSTQYRLGSNVLKPVYSRIKRFSFIDSLETSFVFDENSFFIKLFNKEKYLIKKTKLSNKKILN